MNSDITELSHSEVGHDYRLKKLPKNSNELRRGKNQQTKTF